MVQAVLAFSRCVTEVRNSTQLQMCTRKQQTCGENLENNVVIVQMLIRKLANKKDNNKHLPKAPNIKVKSRHNCILRCKKGGTSPFVPLSPSQKNK